MEFRGIQTLTLLDYPGKVACTLFTGGCDFRCPFCHNAELVLRPNGQPPHPQEEILAFLRKRQGILDGVCVTGGEPLLHAQALAEFLPEVKKLGFQVKLDTNGSHPEELERLLEAGSVDYVAMDVKNDPAHYAETVGVTGFDAEKVKRSAAILMGGGTDFEFRTTVLRGFHTPARMERIGKWLAGPEKYFIQSFVDSGDLIDPGCKPLTKEELDGFLVAVRPYLPNAALRGV